MGVPKNKVTEQLFGIPKGCFFISKNCPARRKTTNGGDATPVNKAYRERKNMKREFLQNFKVGDQQLPKEIIDAIMEENGKDINAAKTPFADYETIKGQLATAQETIKGFESQDLEGIRKSARDWEQKYNDAVAEHKKAMAERDFYDKLSAAITGAKGKNAKAIAALLDLDALKESKNQDADISAAIEACRTENGYLFDDGKTPPPYSAGTGSGGGRTQYTMEQLEKMPMDEYRKFRMGQ